MKNWKTTIAGLLAAGSTAGFGAYQATMGTKGNGFIIAAAIFQAALGFLAKDSNVTGGSVQQ